MPKQEWGPSWGEASEQVRYHEKEIRARMCVEFNPSTVVKGGWAVDMRAMRVRGRNDYYTIAHVSAIFPSRKARKLPDLLVMLAYELVELVQAYDRAPIRAEPLVTLELPLPPDATG